MKIKNATFLTVMIIATTLSTASLANEGQTPKSEMHFKSLKLAVYQPEVYLFKSRGEALAGLRLFQEGTSVEFESAGSSGSLSYDVDGKILTATNGVIVRIVVGTNVLTVTADEVVKGAVSWSDVGKQPVIVNKVKKQLLMPTELIHLKSGGDFIAQLKIPMGTKFEIEGKQGHYDSSGRTTMKGDAMVRISSAVGSSVVVRAEEVVNHVFTDN